MKHLSLIILCFSLLIAALKANPTVSTQLKSYTLKRGVNEFKTALNQLNDHYNNSKTLTTLELEAIYATIELEFTTSAYSSAKNEIWQCINSYDLNQTYVFETFKINQLTAMDVSDRIYIYLLQKIHNQEFNPTNILNMVGTKFKIADIYPGSVKQNATRTTNQEVDINATHLEVIGAKVIKSQADAVRPTGFYAAPGELITVVVPSNLVGKGLKVMIGAHEDDFTKTNSSHTTNRFPYIAKIFEITSVETKIANPFGGGIYIRIPRTSNLGWVKMKISGGIKAPFYSHRSSKVTKLSDWQRDLNSDDVLWADLESDKYLITIPVSVLKDLKMNDPSMLMDRWDMIMDSAFKWLGGRDQQGRTEYSLIDTKIRAKNHSPGYPMINNGSGSPYNLSANSDMPTHMLNKQWYRSRLMVTALHEMGHGAYHAKIGFENESIVHMHAAYIMNALDGIHMDSAQQFSSGQTHPVSEIYAEWMTSPKFRNNEQVDKNYAQYQQKGYAKYIDMARLFGWKSYHNMQKYFYDKWKVKTTQSSQFVSLDEMLRAASFSNNVNMGPLFHFWGHVPSQQMINELSVLPSSNLILDRLCYYKNIAPKKGSDMVGMSIFGGFKGKYQDFDKTFDTDNYAKQIQDQMDLIINTYYNPNPNYCSTVSINEPKLDQLIHIYPNPSSDLIKIECPDECEVKLIDINGKILFHAQDKKTIDVRSFENGIYMLELYHPSYQERYSKKIVINK